MKTAIAIIGAANAAGYLFSIASKSEVVVDLCGTGSIGLSAFVLSRVAVSSSRSLVTSAAITTWSARLALFLAYRAFVDGDARLRAFLPPNGESWADHPRRLLGLTGFFSLQAVWGLVMLTPQVFSAASAVTVPLTRGWIGLAVAAAGFTIEAVADFHKLSAKHSGKDLVTNGLYGIVQYPNYTGEILFWGGLGLYYVSSFGNNPLRHVLAFLPAAFITFLLLRASGIPLTEASRAKRFAGNAEYAEYCKRVPRWLVPGIF